MNLKGLLCVGPRDCRGKGLFDGRFVAAMCVAAGKIIGLPRALDLGSAGYLLGVRGARAELLSHLNDGADQTRLLAFLRTEQSQEIRLFSLRISSDCQNGRSPGVIHQKWPVKGNGTLRSTRTYEFMSLPRQGLNPCGDLGLRLSFSVYYSSCFFNAGVMHVLHVTCDRPKVILYHGRHTNTEQKRTLRGLLLPPLNVNKLGRLIENTSVRFRQGAIRKMTACIWEVTKALVPW